MARSTFSTFHFPLSTFLDALPRSNRHLEAVFGGRVWAFVRRVVITVRMVGAGEVDLVNAAGASIEIEVASGGVRLRAAREVAERHEEPVEARVGLHERGQL